MNNNVINTNDAVRSIPAPQIGKAQGAKRKERGKTRRADDSADKIEIESRAGAGERAYADAVDEKPYDADSPEKYIAEDDVYAFVDAYNRLLNMPGLSLSDMAANIRSQIYKPVILDGRGRQISLYETGIAHSPNNLTEGELSINEGTLSTVLRTRRGDVHALFLREREGLLQRLCSAVIDVPDAEDFLQMCAGLILKYK